CDIGSERRVLAAGQRVEAVEAGVLELLHRVLVRPAGGEAERVEQARGDQRAAGEAERDPGAGLEVAELRPELAGRPQVLRVVLVDPRRARAGAAELLEVLLEVDRDLADLDRAA